MKNNKGLYVMSIMLIAAAIIAGSSVAYQNMVATNQVKLKNQREIARKTQEAQAIMEEERAARERQENATDLEEETVAVSGSAPVVNPNGAVEKKKTDPTNATKVDGDQHITGTQALETMKVPLVGSIQMDFSTEGMVYSNTLKQWTTHDGIDIKAEIGSEVLSAMDGTIASASDDEIWGNTITIDHGNGIKTTYSNLENLDKVRVGQKVKKGEVISTVGQSALYEIADSPHLHFALSKDGIAMDAKQYVPKQAFAKRK